MANLIGQTTVAAAEAVTLVSDALETETATAMAAATGPQGTAVETAVTVTAAAAAGAEPARRRPVLVLLESEAVALTRTETGRVVSAVRERRGERRAAKGAEATRGERGLPDLGAGLGAHPGGGSGHPSLVIQCPCQRYH